MSANPPRKGDPTGAGLRVQRYNNFLNWQRVWESFFEKVEVVLTYNDINKKSADLSLRLRFVINTIMTDKYITFVLK